MTGSPLSKKPSDDFNLDHLEQIVALSATGEISTALLLEWWPHDKINSIPEVVTPYRRNLAGNSLVLVTWKDDTPTRNEFAKQAAQKMKAFMPTGLGYGNYNLSG